LPGHGPILEDARGKIEEYITHRLEREEQIIGLLGERPRSIPDLVKIIYADLPEAMHRYAAASVEAHLEKLQGEERVVLVDGGYALRGSI
jgi:hypothetical protein